MVDKRPVFFFDIDNCLYPKSCNVHDHMTRLIDEYFIKNLSITREEAYRLHQDYYKNYGLAIEGLTRHHKIDPLEYNRQVDDALPLDDIIFPNPAVRKMLEDMDKTKIKLWLFTNAYITHGMRVVKILEIEDLFEGITFCDYGAEKIICKPYLEMYEKAMKEAGVEDMKDCYFIDDSAPNCRRAEEIGWTAIHIVEQGEKLPANKPSKLQIRNLEELRTLFPQFFKTS